MCELSLYTVCGVCVFVSHLCCLFDRLTQFDQDSDVRPRTVVECVPAFGQPLGSQIDCSVVTFLLMHVSCSCFSSRCAEESDSIGNLQSSLSSSALASAAGGFYCFNASRIRPADYEQLLGTLTEKLMNANPNDVAICICSFFLPQILSYVPKQKSEASIHLMRSTVYRRMQQHLKALTDLSVFIEVNKSEKFLCHLGFLLSRTLSSFYNAYDKDCL